MKPTSTVFAGLAMLAFSILLPAWAFGQQNFQPAKVMPLTGDTLQGFVDYRGWDKNPKFVVFKSSLQAPSQTFRPLDIKGFRVNNELYSGAQVVVENSSLNLDNLTSSPSPVFRPDTAFLQAVVNGPRSLYRYKTEGREYFYINQQGKFDLLIFKRYKPTTTYTTIQVNNTYQRQLTQYLADCPTIERRSKVVCYIATDIKKLFLTYYACTNQQASFQRKKIALQAGMLVGAGRTTLRFDAAAAYGPAPAFDRYTTYGPTGGLFFYITLPGSFGHFSIIDDVTYTAFSSSGTATVISSPDNYTTTTSSLSLAYLKLNTQLRFTHPIGVGSLFVNAGMSNGYAIKAQNEKTVVSRFYSTSKTTTGQIFPMQHYESGLVAGFGGSVKKLSLEARYESSGGFLDLVNLSSHFDRFSLLVGYRLF